jgi:hypothetical protein
MDERTRKVGRNEALFRTVNEEIEGLNRGLADISDHTLHITCECGDLLCTTPLPVSIEDYERIRANSALFFIEPGHEIRNVEKVVERTPRFAVVRKNPGEAERIAEATDPRAAHNSLREGSGL